MLKGSWGKGPKTTSSHVLEKTTLRSTLSPAIDCPQLNRAFLLKIKIIIICGLLTAFACLAVEPGC